MMYLGLAICFSIACSVYAARDVAVRYLAHRERVARLDMNEEHAQRLEVLSAQVDALSADVRKLHLARVR